LRPVDAPKCVCGPRAPPRGPRWEGGLTAFLPRPPVAGFGRNGERGMERAREERELTGKGTEGREREKGRKNSI